MLGRGEWAKCRNKPFRVKDTWVTIFVGSCVLRAVEAFEPLGTMVPQNVSSKEGAAHGPRHPSCFWLFFLLKFCGGCSELGYVFWEVVRGLLRNQINELELSPFRSWPLFVGLSVFLSFSLSFPREGGGYLRDDWLGWPRLDAGEEQDWYDLVFSTLFWHFFRFWAKGNSCSARWAWIFLP